MKDQILQFLKNHDFCVISSVNQEGKPESAFVGFSNNDQLEFMIGTSNQSRKYKNISENPAVSIVVADTSAEVQYEGMAYEVDRTNSDTDLTEHFAKLPGSKTYREDPAQTWIIIKPTWIRFIEHGSVDQINEITEFS